MKGLLFIIFFVSICVFQSCSSMPQVEKDIRLEETELLTDVSEVEPVEEYTKEDYINESESYRSKVEEMHNVITIHYSKLVDEYNNQKASYNINSWTEFLNNWNNQLKIYREELDAYKVNGHTYNLFYARNQISSAATSMSAIWLYYSNLLDSKNIDDSRDNIEYFDTEIKKVLEESKKALDDGD